MLRFLVLAGFSILFAAGEFRYREAKPNYIYQFPRDHFNHPDFRTEWWYYTGNLTDQDGHKFGFELVFFRQGERKGGLENASVWRADDIYFAHAALTDIDGGEFHYTERLNRSGPGIAGVSLEKTRVWNGNWEAAWSGNQQKLSAITDDFRFLLTTTSEIPPVIQGVDGVSQKSAIPGRASHYVSLPKLIVRGTLSTKGSSIPVAGQAWMDHEWFTEQLDESQRGWDWFSVQLENGTELMLFDLRKKDGTIDPFSSGTFIDKNGKARHLKAADFQLQPLAYWTSPKTGTRYPVKWNIRIPSLAMDMECKAAIPQQELSTQKGGTSYWEGAVTYTGSNKGLGYLEMTGYDRPVQFK